MLDPLQLIILAVLFLVVLFPVIWAWRLATCYPPPAEPPVEDKDLPRVGVVLCLRGPDVSLERCLAGLMAQDYPDYGVWIVVDGEQAGLTRILDKVANPNVSVHVEQLRERLTTCSLKLSAQIQAISELRQTCSVVAFIDADVVPHREWLKSLVRPLLNPGVGASTGIRWYSPGSVCWGTVVRYIWNAGAGTQMLAFGMPWGGSMAIRMDAIDRAGLLEQWAHSFCEDTSTPRRLHEAGLSLHFVLSATMVNQESIGLKDALTFVRRQLVCTRLHHSSWGMIVLTNVTQALVVPAAIAFVVWCWLCGDMVTSTLGLVIPIFYILGLLSAIVWGERRIQSMVRPRGVELSTFTRSWRAWVVFPLLQVIHSACIMSAMVIRRVSWRGITYAIEGRGKIHLLQYHPYGAQQQTDSAKSLV